MKTFVVLAGLMVIVPRVDSHGEWQGLTVLVLDAERAAHLPGAHYHHHVTKVTNLGGKFHAPLDGKWTVESTAPGHIQIEGDDRYFVLERIYGPDSPLPPIRSECYRDDDVVKACIDKKYNQILRAVVTFTGGWRIRPIEITHDREPRAMVYDDSSWGFVPFPKNELLPRSSPKEMQLSGGLLLEPLNDATPKVTGPHGKLEDPAILPPRICALFAGYAGRCAVMRFLNVMHAMPLQGNNQPEIDFTQEVIYDLFGTKEKPGPAVRYLTILRKDARPEVMDLLYPGGGGSPFPRPCPPPTFAPQVEVTP